MLQEAEKQQQTDLELHAQMFKMYAPVFRAKLNNLNKKAALRVIEYLILFPLETENVRLQQDEKDVFYIGDELLRSKYLMSLALAAEKEHKKEENKEENKKDVRSEESL